jgi:hypothetical protein
MRLRSAVALAAPLLLALACSSKPEGTGTTTATSSGGAGAGPTGGAGGTGGVAEAAPTGVLPDHPRSLPFDYTRPDVGTPLTPAELAAATTQYLEILAATAWFDTIAQRAHGVPQGDPAHRYWYATWWSGVTVARAAGKVTFTHGADGADNNGLRTAQLLEGACYAQTLWKKPAHELLTRRLLRGATSWFLAMETGPGADPFLMARAAYPAPLDVTETPLPLHVDYSPARPGNDVPPAVFIHLPDNPSWPDLWVRNLRSKDDIGHLLRALGEIDTCDGHFADPAAQADLTELRRRFEGFSRRVQADGFAIATLGKDLQEYVPTDGLAHFIKLFECGALLTLEETGHAGAPDVDCGDGNDPVPEGVGALKSSAMQIVRSFHEAAVLGALVHGKPDVAQAMLAGLGKRLDTVMDLIDAGTPPTNFNPSDLVAFMIHAANTGVPLTSREVRWLHARLAEAHASYLDPARAADFALFSPGGADGAYPFEPGGAGIDFKDLGIVLGLCAAEYRNPTTRAALDCDAVKAAAP